MKGDWVEDNKGDVVRSRLFVKQIAYDYRDDVSQSTPALSVFRMMLAFASLNFPLLKTGSNVYIGIWDISVAFMQGRSTSWSSCTRQRIWCSQVSAGSSRAP